MRRLCPTIRASAGAFFRRVPLRRRRGGGGEGEIRPTDPLRRRRSGCPPIADWTATARIVGQSPVTRDRCASTPVSRCPLCWYDSLATSALAHRLTWIASAAEMWEKKKRNSHEHCDLDGRGTRLNPANRYERLHVDLDRRGRGRRARTAGADRALSRREPQRAGRERQPRPRLPLQPQPVPRLRARLHLLLRPPVARVPRLQRRARLRAQASW